MCRAYKLGKKRWSYNQCELKIVQDGGDQRLDIVEAVQVSTCDSAPVIHPVPSTRTELSTQYLTHPRRCRMLN